MVASGLLRKRREDLGLLAHRFSDTACCVGQKGSVGPFATVAFAGAFVLKELTFGYLSRICDLS